MIMGSAFLAPFVKGFLSSPRNTMEASRSSVCMAENSHNRTVNVYNFYGRIIFGYFWRKTIETSGILDTSSKDKTLSLESTQIEEVCIFRESRFLLPSPRSPTIGSIRWRLTPFTSTQNRCKRRCSRDGQEQVSVVILSDLLLLCIRNLTSEKI